MRLPLLITIFSTVLLAVVLWRWAPLGEFYAGMAIGAVLGMANWIWSDPPDHVARWKRGAEGERRTAKAVRPLENRGWRVFHDRCEGRGNIDHIMVGRAGVFLLESKNLSGCVTVEPAGLTVTHEDSGADFTHHRLLGTVLSRAATLKMRIEEETRLRTWVQAVVVIWGEFAAGIVETDNVVYLHGDRLASWLESQPAKLSKRDQRLIELALEAERVAPPAVPIAS